MTNDEAHWPANALEPFSHLTRDTAPAAKPTGSTTALTFQEAHTAPAR